MIKNADKVLAAIRAIQGTEETSEVVDELVQFALPFGFERVFLGQLVNPFRARIEDILYFSTWPDELDQSRLETDSIIHDPVALCALKATRPFRWCDAYAYASKVGQSVVGQAAEFGLKDGYMFPVHAIGSISGGVSLGGEHIEVSPTDILEIELVAQTAYQQLETLCGPFPYQKVVELSPRELEILHFIAAGKTSLEIAMILGIREDTVKKTVKRVSDRYSVYNRAQLVATAMADGKLLY